MSRGNHDEAAPVVLMEAGAVQACGGKPLDHFVAPGGVDPEYMGISPVQATQLVLRASR